MLLVKWGVTVTWGVACKVVLVLSVFIELFYFVLHIQLFLAMLLADIFNLTEMSSASTCE